MLCYIMPEKSKKSKTFIQNFNEKLEKKIKKELKEDDNEEEVFYYMLIQNHKILGLFNNTKFLCDGIRERGDYIVELVKKQKEANIMFNTENEEEANKFLKRILDYCLNYTDNKMSDNYEVVMTYYEGFFNFLNLKYDQFNFKVYWVSEYYINHNFCIPYLC